MTRIESLVAIAFVLYLITIFFTVTFNANYLPTYFTYTRWVLFGLATLSGTLAIINKSRY